MPHRMTSQTLRRLTYFAAVAEAGSIREAARQLGLSVATVSESLSDLEDELGVTLATRNTRALSLTHEGRRVQGIADQMLEAGEALFADGGRPEAITGHVALTASVEVAQSWLPSVLEVFMARHPRVTLALSASDQTVDLVQSPYDLAIRSEFRAPGEGSGPFLPLVCVTALDGAPEPTGDGWHVPQTLLSHKPGAYLDVWETASGRARRMTFDREVLVDNKHVTLAMVARGLGAALVTREAAEAYPGLREVGEGIAFGAIHLSFRLRDKRPSRAALALHDCLSRPDGAGAG